MRYLRTFLKRWYLYIVPILVLPAVMTVYGYDKLLVYQSTALCWVAQPRFLSAQDFGWSSWLTPAQNESQAMGELLQSETFVLGVAVNTDLAKQEDLSTRTGRDQAFNRIKPEVTVSATTRGVHTLSIAVTDKDPHLAQQIVTALLAAYVSNFQQNRQSLDQQAIAFYQQQLIGAQSQQAQDSAKLQDYLQAHPGTSVLGSQTDPTLVQLQQQVTQDQSNVSTINSELTSLRQDLAALPAGTSSFLQVEDPPQLPLQPTLQKSKLLITYTGEYGLGSAAALVGVIVIGLTLLDRKVYSVQDLRQIDEELELELPSIEALPALPARRHGLSERGELKDGIRDGILVPVLTALPPISTESVRKNVQHATRTSSAAPLGAGDMEPRA
jgi:uncharacterized protein involved in exopolysaccharide biosynthesis